MSKIVKVLMIPTENPSSLGHHFDIKMEGEVTYAPDNGFSFYDTSRNFQHKPQHLYFVSDDMVEEGDWFHYHTNISGNIIKQVLEVVPGQITCTDMELIPTDVLNISKIVATSDETLSTCSKLVVKIDNTKAECVSNVKECCGKIANSRYMLPQIPKEFIQRYATRNGEVSIIRLEMNEPVCQCDTFEKEIHCAWKVGIHDCTKPYDGDDPYGHNLKLTDNKVIIL